MYNMPIVTMGPFPTLQRLRIHAQNQHFQFVCTQESLIVFQSYNMFKQFLIIRWHPVTA